MSFVVNVTRNMSAAGPLLVLETPAGRKIEVLSYKITTDAGAGGTSAKMDVALDKCDTAGVGSAATVVNKGDDGRSAGTTAHDGATTPPGYGDRLDYEAVNEAGGWKEVPVLETRPRVGPSSGICLRLTEPPAATTNFHASIEFDEL